MLKRVFAVLFCLSCVAPYGVARADQQIVNMTLCEGDTYTKDFVKTGAAAKGLKIPTVENGAKGIAEGSMDSKGEVLTIKAKSAGATALTVKGQVPALNDAGFQEIDIKYIVTVMNCDFHTGDWVRPKGGLDEEPPPNDGWAHPRQPDAQYELQSLGDDDCKDDAIAKAEYALTQIGKHDVTWRDGKIPKNDFHSFDQFATDAMNNDPAATGKARTDADAWLKKFKAKDSARRYYVMYKWKQGEATGMVHAIGGRAIESGKTITILILVTGVQPCDKVDNDKTKFKTLFAVLVAKFDEHKSSNNHDWHKSGGETKLAEIHQICCGLAERTPTGSGQPPETPKTPKTPANPGTTEKPNPGAVPKPIDKDKNYKVEDIVPPIDVPNEQPYLPPISGPGSTIKATYIDPGQSGPSHAIVALITDDHKTHYYQTQTDQHHTLRFTLPVAIAGAAVTEVLLGKGLKGDHLDDNAAHCVVGRGLTVPNTDALPNVPGNGLAITRGSTAYEPASGQNPIMLQTRGNDPLTTQLTDNGTPLNTLASSDSSVVAQADPNAPLGRHTITMVSRGHRSNDMPADFVKLTPEPVAPSSPGVVETVTVHCDGLGNDPATMSFLISGPATLADGGGTTTVPVTNGVAQVRIRGTHSGMANIAYQLHVTLL